MNELIKILVCPKCRGKLRQLEAGFACDECSLVYPVRDQIPIMLIDQAVPLAEWPEKPEEKCES